MPEAESDQSDIPAAEPVRAGSAILAGGQSRRMGSDKAGLELLGETFLQRIWRVLSGHFQPLIVVCRPDQQTSLQRMLARPGAAALPTVIFDRHSERGPLEGLATALEYLAEAGCERAAVSTCDAPLVQPQLLRWLASQLGTEREAIIPSDGKHLYGLTAAYRTAVWVKLRQLLERGERRIIDLPEHLATEIVTWDACRDVDPQLLSFLNANTPAEYRALCQQATAES